MRQHPFDGEMGFPGRRAAKRKSALQIRLWSGIIAGNEALLYHNVTLERPVLKMWNESGTNRGRIGDSVTVRIRSPRYVASSLPTHTTSGGIDGFGPPLDRQNN
jgi:hypothetical protein